MRFFKKRFVISSFLLTIVYSGSKQFFKIIHVYFILNTNFLNRQSRKDSTISFF